MKEGFFASNHLQSKQKISSKVLAKIMTYEKTKFDNVLLEGVITLTWPIKSGIDPTGPL